MRDKRLEVGKSKRDSSIRNSEASKSDEKVREEIIKSADKHAQNESRVSSESPKCDLKDRERKYLRQAAIMESIIGVSILQRGSVRRWFKMNESLAASHLTGMVAVLFWIRAWVCSERCV